ncbi:hypothetical protein [Streptococcus macacae]|uniref:Uncharacterized protein n=1 Tax=Streptococcus macacae NCTC 11558 TaxID=764298 RepID=G5JW14_9STRE|nr:hypothetical protein [Streptococcus macacae]EHJ52675.1 hypothetical protein STRMA_1425 [Streptococcus macacae NCTC 11558]EHJ53097.1 hypothetical protein STRMA_1427 [Streptococcus macacae NCTC 11558]SUN79345.1 Uncharacterised protein [Streptococcus macacae NCTC 11558]SUN79347.1 Uncharacterised protein [Streptococcus macacae NCTC 11558]
MQKTENNSINHNLFFEEMDSSELYGDGWFIAGAVTGAGVVVGAAILT